MLQVLMLLLDKRRGIHGHYHTLQNFADAGKQLFLLWSEEIHLCPQCQITLKRNGWRKRMVIGLDGEKKTYCLRRLYCPKCKHIHHELPDFIVPYKRYTVQVIEAIVEENICCVPCEDTTIRAFRRWFQAASAALIRMQEKQQMHAAKISRAVSSLHSIQSLSLAHGSDNGWLTFMVMQLIKAQYWSRATHLRC